MKPGDQGPGISRRSFLQRLGASPLAGFLARGSKSKDLEIVRDGRSKYAICLSPQASPSEKRAAAELQTYLEQMTGVRLPIVSDRRHRGRVIAIGESAVTRRLRVKVPKGESFLLRTVQSNLIIAGGRERGTMYGVYGFLEKLGCRWFTRDVTRVPKQLTLAIGPLHEVQSPAFEYREPYFTEALDKDWAARNRTNGHSQHLDASTGGKLSYYPFVHSFNLLIPPDKYFKDHPEYFSLIEGKRRAERSQLCLTNPEVVKLAVERVRQWIAEHPEARIVSVSQNDWTGWCECDNCRRVEAEEGGAHSGPLLRFVNQVAAEIEQSHPGKLIDTLAYWYTEEPPALARPRPNVRIRLCPIRACEAHAYERCERNASFMKTLKSWSRITNQLYIWHYNTNFRHFLLPFPDYDELSADIPMYKRHGVVGLFLEGAVTEGGGAEDAELRSYVMARLLWNPETDVQRDIDEFFAEVYGPAAGTMRACFDLRHRAIRRGTHMWIYDHVYAPYLSTEFLAEARALLNRAETEAQPGPAQRRVRAAALSLDYIEAMRAKRFQVSGFRYAPSDLAAAMKGFHAMVARARELGITHFREGAKVDADVQDFAARIRPYVVVSIESEALRAEIVPDLNARVIALTDKASGRNLLRTPDPGEFGYPDLSGLSITLRPDYGRKSYAVKWRLASSGANEAILEGDTAEGCKVLLAFRIEGRELTVRAAVTNAAASAIPLAIQSSADISGDPADDDISVDWTGRSDAGRKGRLYETGGRGTDTESLTGDRQPAGEWTVAAPSAGVRLTNRFAPSEVPRCVLSWSVMSGNRAEISLWTAESELQPGQTAELQSRYVAPGLVPGNTSGGGK